jgi:hypothetical protein
MSIASSAGLEIWGRPWRAVGEKLRIAVRALKMRERTKTYLTALKLTAALVEVGPKAMAK